LRIRITGTPDAITTRETCKAVRFFASKLMRPSLIETLHLHIRFQKISGCEAITEWMDKPERCKRLRITINPNYSEYHTLTLLAHEMVHVKQYATGQVRDYVSDEGLVKWKGVHHDYQEAVPETYWFAPWELEAYGMQVGLVQLYIDHHNSKLSA
jgi:hypothetical protein